MMTHRSLRKYGPPKLAGTEHQRLTELMRVSTINRTLASLTTLDHVVFRVLWGKMRYAMLPENDNNGCTESMIKDVYDAVERRRRGVRWQLSVPVW